MSRAGGNQFRKFLTCVPDFPAEKVLGLQVIVIEHLRENLAVFGIAESIRRLFHLAHYPFAGIVLLRQIRNLFLGRRIGNGCKIRIINVFPA